MKKFRSFLSFCFLGALIALSSSWEWVSRFLGHESALFLSYALIFRALGFEAQALFAFFLLQSLQLLFTLFPLLFSTGIFGNLFIVSPSWSLGLLSSEGLALVYLAKKAPSFFLVHQVPPSISL